MRVNDHYPLPPQDSGQSRSTRRTQEPSKAEEAQSRAGKAEPGRGKTLHKAEDLRQGVENLVDSGDVRPNRVEEARQHKDSGTYNQPSVLNEIVDRLLEQWNIG